ncbi:type IV secretion system DNA-binding domain-containing protein [Pseudohalocynthiibacter sp. F2068]|jgi:type IV secretory pathway TraG/TraD family ATPase VirD4|uniref:type IV secretory system conjugative DNA transfer family protein n=1 Tax=Pseudohalocynthiibacter sp. F2068 TaxID=2926418 RepID=UPI001FF2B188|nr:type IV secretion system DNA-binding domain-containing protein [Pseudohalocynthiibacter sp. F2068]MCK0104262.1 type IV secretion system DNA-binding domain-containing protein [Pseudohalocynthiibacter sp. F2068]
MTWDQNSVATIGTAYSRDGNRSFGIRLKDRSQHIYILGQTGTGKSTLLSNLMRQDLQHGHGFCLIDPHGDLAKQITEQSDAYPTRDTIIWNTADPACPYGYNPMTRVSKKFRPLLASGLIDTLKKQWADAWGARMEHLLRYSILALLEQPKTDVRDIMRMFLESSFRREVLTQVTDEQVCLFWQKEFPAMNYKNAADGVAPIANKLGAFLAHPVIRRALCEPEVPLRLRKIMDEGQILIINLAKGQLGSDTSNVLGGMIASGLAHAAYSRHTLSEAERRPFFLYVDEFHSFTTDAMAEMLSELRKYGLSLTLANQYFGQIEGAVLDSILGNVGSLIAFRTSPKDAPILSRHLDGVEPRDLIAMPNYRMVVRLMVDGERTKAFTAWGHFPFNCGYK